MFCFQFTHLNSLIFDKLFKCNNLVGVAVTIIVINHFISFIYIRKSFGNGRLIDNLFNFL